MSYVQVLGDQFMCIYVEDNDNFHYFTKIIHLKLQVVYKILFYPQYIFRVYFEELNKKKRL